MIKYGLASVTVLLVLFSAAGHSALAEEAEYRLLVSVNSEAVAGDFAVDLEMKISDAGQAPKNLNSLTIDVNYADQLSAYPAPDSCALHWALSAGYEASVSRLPGYYRVLVTGNGVPTLGDAWPVTEAWQRLVTLRWKIATVTGSYAVTMSDVTDAAAFFTAAPPGDLSEWNTTLTGAANVQLAARLFLQGPYDSNSHHLRTALSEGGFLPTTSPYGQDSRMLNGAVPAGIADWLLLQLRSTATGATVCSKSVLLRNDGLVVADDGATAVVSMATLEGEKEYFVVVKHRNHLAAMSSTGIGLSSSAAANYDYSTGLDKYFGAEAQEIEPGVFALHAGDSDASGIINAADYFSVKPHIGFSGYAAADVDMTTIVNAADYFVIKANVGKTSNIP